MYIQYLQMYVQENDVMMFLIFYDDEELVFLNINFGTAPPPLFFLLYFCFLLLAVVYRLRLCSVWSTFAFVLRGARLASHQAGACAWRCRLGEMETQNVL